MPEHLKTSRKAIIPNIMKAKPQGLAFHTITLNFPAHDLPITTATIIWNMKTILTMLLMTNFRNLWMSRLFSRF